MKSHTKLRKTLSDVKTQPHEHLWKYKKNTRYPPSPSVIHNLSGRRYRVPNVPFLTTRNTHKAGKSRTSIRMYQFVFRVATNLGIFRAFPLSACYSPIGIDYHLGSSYVWDTYLFFCLSLLAVIQIRGHTIVSCSHYTLRTVSVFNNSCLVQMFSLDYSRR